MWPLTFFSLQNCGNNSLYNIYALRKVRCFFLLFYNQLTLTCITLVYIFIKSENNYTKLLHHHWIIKKYIFLYCRLIIKQVGIYVDHAAEIFRENTYIYIASQFYFTISNRTTYTNNKNIYCMAYLFIFCPYRKNLLRKMSMI